MGFFNLFPCCGSRAEKNDEQTPADTDPLLPPRATAESIASQEGYGSLTMSTADAGGLSGKQRKRLADIGREVGNHMLPINQASRAATTSPSARQPSSMRAPSPDSGSSASRPTTPSPERDGDERLSSSTADLEAGGDDDDRSAATRSGAATPIPAVPDADGVVHKQLFRGGGGAKRGGAARGGKQKGRGRGRGRSKKMK